jgi:propanol-preferring alcohol dehydrogenase
MKAMVLEKQGSPLVERDMPVPGITPKQVLVKVHACGVCRTDLHVLDGDLKHPALPLILGHEITGEVAELGDKVTSLKVGDKVGIPWLGYTCGYCSYCSKGMENLCENAKFTGYTLNGGYAEYTAADEKYCFPVPHNYALDDAAPLLCAGLIGYRSLKIAEKSNQTQIKRLGIYGFGAAAHIIAQIATFKGIDVYAFTRTGDRKTQKFAKSLGCVWTGDSDSKPEIKLDAAIIFAPIGSLVPKALETVDKGGAVICGGIHMSDIPQFSYDILWEERIIRSVANLTREDGIELLNLAPEAGVKTTITKYPLNKANEALSDLRKGRLNGAAVLIP